MLLYGRHRVGKSTFAASMAEVPELTPILWIAAEDGTVAFEGKYPEGSIDVVHTKTWEEIHGVVEAVLDNKTKYKSIVVDTVGQVQEIIKRDFLATYTGSNSYEQWAKVNEGLVWLMDSIHNSTYSSVFIAHHEKVKDDVEGGVYISPYFLGKKSSTDIPKIPDTIAYMAKSTDDDGNPVRKLVLTALDRIDAGSRLEHKLPPGMVNPSMKEFYSHITEDS